VAPYRLILSLALPVVLARLAWRILAGREAWTDFAERLGGGARGAPGGLWLHAASNGELASALGILAALRDRRPDLPILITTNSLTGRALARREGYRAALAPVDARLAVARFLARHRPAALVTMEAELWPNRFAACAARDIPILVLGARMSARSARGWARLPGLARRVLALPRLVAPQDAESGARLMALGLPAARLGPVVNLKAAPALAAADPGERDGLARDLPRADTILAASTHAGEEALILEAFLAARRTRPGLRLILAPRHPARGAEVAAAIRAAGLAFTRRSAGQAPGAAPVYLADTLGEMALWYALAGVTIVAGSFTDRGGHTPHEPAAAGSAILHGPDVANFAASYAALDAGGGALACADAAALAAALADLADPARQAAMAAAARRILAAEAPDFAPLVAAVEAALDPAERSPDRCSA